MKIGAFSDTHTLHKGLQIEHCDVLICAGDIMNSGYVMSDIIKFLDWFSEQPSEHKIFIAGNHDRLIENESLHITQRIRKEYLNITYLENSEVIIDGIKFYGSPITPTFYNWAFMADRGKEIRKYWDLIPLDTDVLITHGPPFDILDNSMMKIRCGCEELRKSVMRIKPKIHLFGHIHEGRGQLREDDILFANVTVLNENYRLVYPVMYFNI